MQELKPCPFCGSDAVLTHEKGRFSREPMWTVRCTNAHCPAYYIKDFYHESPGPAEDAWNKRVNL